MKKMTSLLAIVGRLLRRTPHLSELVNMQFLRLVDRSKVVTGVAPLNPSSTTPDYVSMKGYQKFTALIVVDNGATVTGSAITVKQATAVDGTSEKAVSFTKMWSNIDTGAADTLAEQTVSSDTFTTDTTDNKNLLYVVEIDASDLDLANDFDCIRIGTGNAANMIMSALYILHGARYQPSLDHSAITD